MGLNTETLESLCELVIDCPHSTPKWTDEGIIVLRNQNIKNGVLDLSTPSYTHEDDYQKRIKRAVPQAGDIVFTREAPMGEVCIIPKNLKCCLGQRQVLLRPRNDVCGEYLFWALQSPYVQHQIAWNEGTGTTVSNVRIPVLKALLIPRYPDSEKQSAHILSTLAQKIELNTQTNQTLEKMAQTLFKSWFVDFDPVFDNALAKADFNLEALPSAWPAALVQRATSRLQVLQDNPTLKAKLTQHNLAVTESNTGPAQTSQAENTHQHFPSEFEPTDEPSIGINGWIPKGWQAGSLSSIAKFTSERIDSVDLTFENYISTDNMFSNRGGVENASKLPAVKTTPAFKSGDILISNIRPYFKKIWFASKSGGRSNDVLGFESINEKSKEFLFNLLYQDIFFDYMMTTSKGSKMPRGDKKAIMDWYVSIPPNNLQEYFSKFVQNYYQVIPVRNKEIESLTKLRDTLLPKLISGELKIPDSLNIAENNN